MLIEGNVVVALPVGDGVRPDSVKYGLWIDSSTVPNPTIKLFDGTTETVVGVSSSNVSIGTGTPSGGSIQEEKFMLDVETNRMYTSTDGTNIVDVSASIKSHVTGATYKRGSFTFKGGVYYEAKIETNTAPPSADWLTLLDIPNSFNTRYVQEWSNGIDVICYGSDRYFYYPNLLGNPATNDPVAKTNDDDWYGPFESMGGAIKQQNDLIKIILDSKEVSMVQLWTNGVTSITQGSNSKYYFPNINGDPGNNDPVAKTTSVDWYGPYDLLGDAIKKGITVSADVITDKTPQLGGSLDCNGFTVNKQSVRGIADATVASATHTFNYANGDMQQVLCTTTGSIVTFAFSNFPSGKVCGFVIDLVNAGRPSTINFPSGTRFTRGTRPEFTYTGYDRLLVVKDKDNIYTVTVVALDFKA